MPHRIDPGSNAVLHCSRVELSSAILAFMTVRGDESFLAVVRNLPNTFEMFFASSGECSVQTRVFVGNTLRLLMRRGDHKAAMRLAHAANFDVIMRDSLDSFVREEKQIWGSLLADVILHCESNAAWKLDCSISFILRRCQGWQSSFDPAEHLVLLWCISRLARADGGRERLLQGKVQSILWEVYRKGTYISRHEERNDDESVRATQSLLALALLRLTDGRLSLSMVSYVLSSLLLECVESNKLSASFGLVEVHLWEVLDCLHRCCLQQADLNAAGVDEIAKLLFLRLPERFREILEVEERGDDLLHVHNVMQRWSDALVCGRATMRWFLQKGKCDLPIGSESAMRKIESCAAVLEGKEKEVEELIGEYVKVVQGELESTALLEGSRRPEEHDKGTSPERERAMMQLLEDRIESA
ncbi:hypothetical protein GUITHDRAFT_121760 [Guillardia theta CCMP2712]|uniref:Uncharacterized protein n=1 Tax=Guillardia theta (strain CCMP2712) TaxID=905079 RepID=L1I876_GUITC|nr:hypothetical protein GUITHDRAFT_121760 [Guillardia theta CCMP2712]EKX32060.1 hypothetical protein GUITHDRAFT_121760 [Guillardia theta CCMP2712]|eukprot:XP_005819040.1 hypothetical protein GUITHDRAFT_121760 [Guillardia theta CCMP2712]